MIVSPALATLPPAAWIAVAYAAANLVAFAVFAWDKRAASRGAGPAGRIRERALHLWTLATGGLGALAAIAWLRHKSLHLAFWLNAVGSFVVHAGFWCWWFLRGDDLLAAHAP